MITYLIIGIFVLRLFSPRVKLFTDKLLLLPVFLLVTLRDRIIYIKNKGYRKFSGFGIHIFTGSFGSAKTSSMVVRAYKLSCKYPDLYIVTNIQLKNFPHPDKILPLKSPQDILNAPRPALILIDEIGTIFNSRDFAKSKESVPKPVYQHLCQCRHRDLMIYGTCQNWGQLDKQIRDISASVRVCSIKSGHPFSRLATVKIFDRFDYDMWYSDRRTPIKMISGYCYIQTDDYRELYDTNELVTTMLSAEYLSDQEILENQGEITSIFGEPLSPKAKKAYKRAKAL